jgi:TPR repeat protein
MAQAEKDQNSPAKNPLLWVSLIVVGLIIFIFAATDRGGVSSEKIPLKQAGGEAPIEQEKIERELLVPAGLRAREYIRQVRAGGKPYPFDEVMDKAASFSAEGSLADAHLVYFFAAREGHVDAMMIMGEMSDPTLFNAQDNLLDQPDAVQAYKWYRLALDKGYDPARGRLDNLHSWARVEATYGDTNAYQLLLNFN